MLLPTDLPRITFTNTQGTSSFPSPSPTSLLLDPSPRPDSYSRLWLTSTKGPDRDISLIKVMRLKIHNPHYTTLEMRRQAGKTVLSSRRNSWGPGSLSLHHPHPFQVQEQGCPLGGDGIAT